MLKDICYYIPMKSIFYLRKLRIFFLLFVFVLCSASDDRVGNPHAPLATNQYKTLNPDELSAIEVFVMHQMAQEEIAACRAWFSQRNASAPNMGDKTEENADVSMSASTHELGLSVDKTEEQCFDEASSASQSKAGQSVRNDNRTAMNAFLLEIEKKAGRSMSFSDAFEMLKHQRPKLAKQLEAQSTKRAQQKKKAKKFVFAEVLKSRIAKAKIDIGH